MALNPLFTQLSTRAHLKFTNYEIASKATPRLFIRLALTLALSLCLTGCLQAIPPQDFAPTYEVLAYPVHKKFKGKIDLSPVQIQDKIYGALTPEHLTRALTEATTKAGYLAQPPGSGKYQLTTRILNVDRPLFAFQMNVKVTIQYQITDKSNGALLFNETATVGHQVGFFEAENGDELLRLALGKAISGNFTHFLRALSVSASQTNKS
jgi:hypothetical protein